MRSSKKEKITLNKVWLIGVVIALSLAAVMRLPFFAHIPTGLNRDEAALGYNAYSLLKSGIDEYGKHWPVSITSFGDQKLPGYVYTLIPFIAIFHLSIFTVRLPSLLAGFVVLVAVGVLALQLGNALKLSLARKNTFSILAMVFVAIEPFANHFSRVAYEAHLALAFFLVGLVLYNIVIESTQYIHQRVFLPLVALLWSLTLLTYHSYHIFIPIFLLGLLIIDFVRIKKMDRWGVVTGIIIGLCTVGLLYHGGVFQGDAVKNAGISPFSKQQLEDAASAYRAITPGENALYERILFNPLTEAVTKFSQNIASVFSGNFFFVHGSGHGDHNPGNLANMHVFIAPLLFFGAFYIWANKRKILVKRVLLWIICAIIPAALPMMVRWIETHRWSLFLLAAGVMALWWWSTQQGMTQISSGLDPIIALRFTHINILMYASLVIIFLMACAQIANGKMRKMTKPLYTLGGFSYAVYLFHTLALRIIFTFL